MMRLSRQTGLWFYNYVAEETFIYVHASMHKTDLYMAKRTISTVKCEKYAYIQVSQMKKKLYIKI